MNDSLSSLLSTHQEFLVLIFQDQVLKGRRSQFLALGFLLGGSTLGQEEGPEAGCLPFGIPCPDSGQGQLEVASPARPRPRAFWLPEGLLWTACFPPAIFILEATA